MKLLGIWTAFPSGVFVVALLNTVFFLRINWERESRNAQERSEKVEFEQLVSNKGDEEGAEEHPGERVQMHVLAPQVKLEDEDEDAQPQSPISKEEEEAELEYQLSLKTKK
jgi:hypothetical protein